MPVMDVFRRFVAELKRRRVLEVVAIYAGLSFGLLQGADIVVDALRLPPALLTLLTVLVLLGFPVVLVIGWTYDLDMKGRLSRTPSVEVEREELSREGEGQSPGQASPGEASWRRGVVIFASLVVLVSASWLTVSWILTEDVAGAMLEPSGSYVVVPFHARSQTEDSRIAAVRAARSLTRQLNGWDSVRVVQSVALDGLMSRLGLDEDAAPSLEQAFEMAEKLRAGTLVGLAVEATGGEASLEAVLYDVDRRRQIGRPVVLHGFVTDLAELVAPVAQDILELRHQSVSVDDLRSESRNPRAHQAFEDGLDALHDWRLEAAENHFRSSIREDAAFASAHHYLALALYWQASRDPSRILEVGPEIARATQSASRLASSGSVRPGLRPHIDAFRAFWSGDYATARRMYGDIVAKTPSDTEAWLLLGTVEYKDPVLREISPDSLVPRRNLNVARRAFESAARLSPDWQISYGLLFEMDRMLASAALNIRCLAFERPDAPFRSPFEPGDPENIAPRAYCPVVEDSITWISAAEMTSERQRAAIDNVERLTAESRRLLESWTSIHPDQPRPHDELADWLAWRRATLGCKADSAVVRQLTSDILVERSTSLLLRADTTREDLIRLAVLNLALDEVGAATSLVDRALRDLPPGAPVPDEAANVFLALGLPGRAFEITRPMWSTIRLAIRDPEGDAPLSMGDISRPITRLRLYGATSLTTGPDLAGAFDDLFGEWARRGYSPVQAAHIRRHALSQDVGPALALDARARARWFEDWETAGLEIPAVWRAFLGSDSALDEALGELRDQKFTRLDDHYLVAVLLADAGRHQEAIDQFRLLEACPLVLDAQSVGWGLRTLGRWHLAQSYFAVGDSTRAREALARYTALRADRGPIAE